ncbi:glycosyltransferase [Candidatus Woesearchaeota archaeon]|nr:glycosyltransferase [Candidatus Woesearchaeota archaeon]
MPGKHVISATVVVYNEESRIKACLDAVRGVVDEIIVVHDGPCSDRTLEIAGRYTKKIFVRPHWGEASPHKPFTLEVASGDWILTVDADEILTPPLRRRLRRLVDDADKESINGYAFYWPFYDKGVRITKGPLSRGYKLVLFRKSATVCTGVIHDWYHVAGRVRQLDLELDHRQPADNWTFRSFFRKNVPRTVVDARYRVEKGFAGRFVLWYLFKAPLWFVLYFFYTFFLTRLFLNGYIGFRMAVQLALYNFFLNWHIFRIRLGRIFK